MKSVCTILCVLSFASVASAANERAFFEERVQPLLARHCFECHSHDAKKLGGGLTLDSRKGWQQGGDSGAAVVPGKPDESLLIKAVRHTSQDLQMPPGKKLSDNEIEVLVEWVRRGAIDPRESPASDSGGGTWAAKLSERRKHWCWQPVVKPRVPDVQLRDWPLNGIDRFVLARLESEGLSPAPDADGWSMTRRLSFVLTGLPPDTVEPFPDGLVVDLIDRTLASPHFGEHWARHWMDLVRYSDTHGSEHDPLIPHAWRYRDYLIRALNGDVPYDRFVREHLAGDLLPPRWNPTLGIDESPIGTGWFRFVEFYPTPIDVKNEEIVVIDAQIDSFSKTFQGLTIACARCHDHKFDAISAHDFAALYGIFASSRTTMHRVNDPVAQHAFDRQLIEFKRPIRQALAELWREQLDHWPTAIPAAREKAHEPAPPKPTDKDKPATQTPPPFAPGTRSLEAESYRWLTALKLAKDKPTEPLHSLMRTAPTPIAPSTPPASDRFRWFADFGLPKGPPASTLSESGQESPNETSIPNSKESQGWFSSDNFRPIRAAGEFALSPSGHIITAIYPLGRFSHLISNKHGGTLRSPNFTLDMKFVSVLAGGTNGARVRLVIENFPSDGVLFGQVMPTLNEPRLKWITLPVRPAWVGSRAYLEISPRDEMTYPGKHSDASVLNTDGRSGVAVRAVAFHDLPGAPELASPLPLEVWAVEPSWSSFANQFTKLARDAINAWADERCSEEQARFVDELLRSGVLLNEAPADHELARWVAQYRELESQIPVPTRVSGVTDEAAFDERLFVRGNHRKPGPLVQRRYLEVLDHRHPVRQDDHVGSGRRELADAILDPSNPLTARVMVNRLWQHVFGVGLVKSVDNFGHLGEAPSHPELLDWLAAEFVESGWSIKHMLRLMLTSRTFQLSTDASLTARKRDPNNRLLSHANLRRLQAESLRDSLLFVSGQLNRQQGGLGVPLPLRTGYKDFDNPLSGPPDGNRRRSIYLEARRNYPQPLLIAFDQPKPVLTIGERSATNVPAQSLTLLNDKFVVQQSSLFAQRVLSMPTPEDRIQAFWRIAFARPISDDELFRSIEFLKSQAKVLGLTDNAWQTDPSVWNDLAHALINTKEFLYLR